ncbi:MAG: fluoride efflux transporter CrcB [Candidimonas sp.]|nr:fluoride efflux transporter CrcB [Candidimonas sp.]NYT44731.1 fluoride efflux transporter CrcB [Alcaligenaceae bacterium]
MFSLPHLLAVAGGASIGALCRWGLDFWINRGSSSLPWGTLGANLVGGYLVGLVLGWLSLNPDLPVWLRLMLVTGFLGGLTTFSTFSAEAFGMLERGAYATALGYVGLSLLGSLGLTALGFATVRMIRSGM